LRTIRSFTAQPLAVRLLLVNQLGVNLGFYMVIPYLAVHLEASAGMSLAAIGIVLGVRNLAQQGLFLIGGTASDRLGPRGVIIAGCLMRAFGFGLFALTPSLPVLIAASVVSGVAGALFNPAVRAYVAEAAGERRAEAFALFNLFANTGMCLGPVVGSALVVVDFRLGALVSALVFLGLAVAQMLALPPHRAPKAATTVLGGWRDAFADKGFLAFTLATAALFALQNQLYLLLPTAAVDATGTAWATAAVFGASTVATLGLQVRSTDWCQRHLSRAAAIALGMALIGAAFLPPVLMPATAPGPHFAAVLAAALLLSIGVMVAQPFVMELIPGYAPQGLTGTYFGVYYLLSGVVAALGTSAVGLVADLAGDRAAWASWICCALLGLASAAAVAAMRGSRSLARAVAAPPSGGAQGPARQAPPAQGVAPQGSSDVGDAARKVPSLPDAAPQGDSDSRDDSSPHAARHEPGAAPSELVESDAANPSPSRSADSPSVGSRYAADTSAARHDSGSEHLAPSASDAANPSPSRSAARTS
jgi:predicted MFS family arabinose efflux permease